MHIAIFGRESGGGLGVVFILVAADGHRAHVAVAAARVDVVLSHGAAAAAAAAVGVISNRCRKEE